MNCLFMLVGIGNKSYEIKCFIFLILQGISCGLWLKLKKKCVKSEYKITKLITHIYAVNLLEHSSR